MTATAPGIPPLRERRRREMARAIANAAVELFERDGVAATTVDDIAAAAGISRTTFFRHCPGKEAAVLVDDGGFEAELISAAASASSAQPLSALDDAWNLLIDAFDGDAEGHDRFLRVRRLMNGNAALHAAGLQRNAALAARIAETLRERAGLAPLDARAAADVFAVTMNLAFDEWVRRVDAGTAPSLRNVHQDVLAALEGAGVRRAR